MNSFIKFLIVVNIILLFMSISKIGMAGDLTHQWVSPSFSGVGYSSHVLTIENQEHSRKKAIKEMYPMQAGDVNRAENNTTIAKFIKNVESRIYAQLSKQLVDSMFGENSNQNGTVTFEGTTISYVKDTDNVALTILDANGSQTVITVPIGDFTF